MDQATAPSKLSLMFYISQIVWISSVKSASGFFRISIICLIITLAFGYLLFPIPGAPNRNNRIKTFGIGLSRTGTTTLTKAMHDAGFVAVHAPLDFFNYSDSSPSINRRCADGYDFIGDVMPSLKFEELATLYPESKFIFTKRHPRDFARSAEQFFKNKGTIWKVTDELYNLRLFPIPTHRFFQDLYGKDYLDYDISDWNAVYEKYEERVRSFFARGQRRDRLLELNVVGGEGWEKLGPFLNIDPPVSSDGNTSLRKVDVFESVIEQSIWMARNFLSWIYYWMTRS